MDTNAIYCGENCDEFTYHQVKIEPPVVHRKMIDDDGKSLIFNYRNSDNAESLYRRPYSASESLKLSDILKAVPLNTNNSIDQEITRVDIMDEVRKVTTLCVSSQLERNPIRVPCPPALSNSNSDIESSEEEILQNDEVLGVTTSDSEDDLPIVPFSVSITTKTPKQSDSCSIESEELEKSVNICNKHDDVGNKSEASESIESNIKSVETLTVHDSNNNFTDAIKKLSVEQNSKIKTCAAQLQATTFNFTLPKTPDKCCPSNSWCSHKRMLRSYSAQLFLNPTETFPKLRPLSATSQVSDRKRVVPNIVNFQSSDLLQGHSLSVSKQALHTFNYIRSLENEEIKYRSQSTKNTCDMDNAAHPVGNRGHKKHSKVPAKKSECCSRTFQKFSKFKQNYLNLESFTKPSVSAANKTIVDNYLNDVQYSFRMSMVETKNDIHNVSGISDEEYCILNSAPLLENKHESKNKLSSKALKNPQNKSAPNRTHLTFNHLSSTSQKSSNKSNKKYSENNIRCNLSSKEIKNNIQVVRPTRQVLDAVKGKVKVDKNSECKTITKRISSAPIKRRRENTKSVLETRVRPSTAACFKKAPNQDSFTNLKSLPKNNTTAVVPCKDIPKVSNIYLTPEKTKDVRNSNEHLKNASLSSSVKDIGVQSSIDSHLESSPKKPQHKKKRSRYSNKKKAPVTMVSKIKQDIQNNNFDYTEIEPRVNSNLENRPATSQGKKVRFQLGKLIPEVEKLKPVKKAELDAYFEERDMTNSIISDECSGILTKLKENNINVSMDTLKRALMKPYERTLSTTGSCLPRSDSRLMEKPRL